MQGDLFSLMFTDIENRLCLFMRYTSVVRSHSLPILIIHGNRSQNLRCGRSDTRCDITDMKCCRYMKHCFPTYSRGGMCNLHAITRFTAYEGISRET